MEHDPNTEPAPAADGGPDVREDSGLLGFTAASGFPAAPHAAVALQAAVAPATLPGVGPAEPTVPVGRNPAHGPVRGPLFLTVVRPSSGASAPVRVEAERPARELAGYLAGSVGVPNLVALLRRDGSPLVPDLPLGSQGIRSGASLLVIDASDPPPAFPAQVETSSPLPAPDEAPNGVPGAGLATDVPLTDAPSTEAFPAQPVAAGQPTFRGFGDLPVLPPIAAADPLAASGTGGVGGDQLPPLSLPPLPPSEERPASGPSSSSRGASSGARIAAVAVAAVVVAGGMFALGAVLFHDSGSDGSSPGRVAAVATAAAQDWLHATPFNGPTVAGVPTGLSRQGPIAGSLEPVSSWRDSTSSGEVFIVTGGPSPFGLTVTLSNGKLSAPPVVTGLPFASAAIPPSSGNSVPVSGAPPAATTWVGQMWGTATAAGTWTDALNLGVSGSPRVLSAWTAKSGGTVVRLQVGLSSSAPGTKTAQAATNAQAVSSAQSAEQTALTTLNQAKAAATAASSKLAADEAAANPPASPTTTAHAGAPASSSTTAAAPSAAQKAAAAAVPGDTAALQQATAALATAQRGYNQARAATQAALAAQKSGPSATPTVTAVGTYDLWVSASGSLLGWAPAGYAAS